MNNAEVIADFRRRYEGTYVWLKMEGPGCETLVHVERIEGDNTKMGILHLTSQEYGELRVNFGSSDHSLKFKYPPVGVFQCDDQALIFTRRPTRQYRRGLCTDNSSLVTVSSRMISNTARWTMNEVAAAFKAERVSFDRALNQMQDKRIKSVALANEFSLCKSVTKDKEHMLLHWENPIARIDRAGKVTQVLEEVYRKDIDELVSGGLR